MTDLFERQLAERLQAHRLPEEIPDLGIRSVRLGERIRRRRIGAVVLALVLLLVDVLSAGLPWLDVQFLTDLPSRRAAAA